MIAMGAKKLFQIIIGAGQIRDTITVKETRPIALRDFVEVSQSWGKGARLGPVTGHGAQESAQASFHRDLIVCGFVAQNRVGPLDPAIAHLDIRPEVSGLGQSPLQQRL
jgi:hypothetical protein